MKRRYYSSESVDALEQLEIQLEEQGIDAEQIHVMSNHEALFRDRHLHMAGPFTKRDMFRSGFIGFGVGAVASVVIFIISAQSGITNDFTVAPAAFLSLAVLGFCTWEGGLWGIQRPSREYERFYAQLKAGKHIMYVDHTPEQEAIVKRIFQSQASIKEEGKGEGAAEWVTFVKKRVHRLFNWSPELSTR